MNWVTDAGAVVYDRLYQIGKQATHYFGPAPADRYPGGDKAPVLLLPGVYETWQFLRPAADYLYGLGHPIHALPELGYNRGRIAESATLAEAYLDAHDLRGVILLGHSKGGIIGKRMMVADDAAGRIAQLIAVCSPFGGSSLARFAPNPALRAFHPRNALLLELAEERAANARITSIYPRLDPIVPNGSRLDGATNVQLPMVGHFRPLSSPRLFSEIGRVVGAEVEE
ncbi:MAG: alpha/beta hydrolase [Microbacteriaceae bacterium]|jgi:triacylglycerol lipase|nr:alpha/beta hydrolase [Microbacteriaceae bacterium]